VRERLRELKSQYGLIDERMSATGEKAAPRPAVQLTLFAAQA